MTRSTLVLLALLFLSAAFSQEGQVSFVSSGPVTFTVTPEAYADAAACPGCGYLYPDPGPAVVLEVRRQNPNRLYTLDVFYSGFGLPGSLQLEAHYTVTNSRGNRVLLVTDWLPITETPTQLFTQQAVGGETTVLVEVAYRLRVSGHEPAGEYLARVTYSIRESNSAVAHDVRVSLPSFLALRLVGTAAPGLAHTLHFDYSEVPLSYLHAVSSGTPLAVTSSDLVRVELSTNHPTGYTVTVSVEELLGPLLRDRLYLAGAPAHGRRLSSTGPTNGFVTLFTEDDFSLVVDGSEPPGIYVLTVRYEVERNP